MKVVEAPTPREKSDHNVSVFLGGGITNCPDWQFDMIMLLDKRLSPLGSSMTTMYNPRRSEFDVNDPAQSEVQIKWEFDHLKESDIIMFWFPAESVCPITLFELGKHMLTGQCVCVGCHPDYIRKFDVEFQLGLEFPGFFVADSLEALADEVAKSIALYCGQI